MELWCNLTELCYFTTKEKWLLFLIFGVPLLYCLGLMCAGERDVARQLARLEAESDEGKSDDEPGYSEDHSQ